MATISDELHMKLGDALSNGDVELAASFTQQALSDGIEPLDIIQQVIVPTLTKVGQDFQDFAIFLPELMAAGEAAEKATAILEEYISSSGEQSSSIGTVVIGTVENDVHDIGKNIFCTLLRSHGFKIVDLGRDVPPSAFLEASQKEKPNIIAMSSLMTTTRPYTRSTINLFKEVGLREHYQFVVGGGCVTQDWADEIGANGYAPNAASAVEMCKMLLHV